MSSKPSGGGLRLRDVRRGGIFAGCRVLWMCVLMEDSLATWELYVLSQTIAPNFTRAALTCDDGKSEGRLHFLRLADLLGSSRLQRSSVQQHSASASRTRYRRHWRAGQAQQS
jgi:hypothetical protein